MTYKTHMQGGVIASAFANLVNPIIIDTTNWQSILFTSCDLANYIVVAWIAAVLPDFDSGSSLAANGIYLIDDLLRDVKINKKRMFAHRGLSHFNIKFSIKFLIKQLKRKSILRNILNGLNYIIESKFTTVLFRYSAVVVLVRLVLDAHLFIKALVIGYCSHIVLDYIMSYLGVKTGSNTENKIVYNILGWCAILSVIWMIERGCS